ncbi:MAG: hypothetical protein MZW92_52775 [Comamonadaceae bacterium]|nr:hypothetical protein [Comamonadaceae bacterium]
MNLLNPNPYISWSLILGPLLLQAWKAAPANGIALLAAFYVTMVVSTAVILLPFAGAAPSGRVSAAGCLACGRSAGCFRRSTNSGPAGPRCPGDCPSCLPPVAVRGVDPS